MRIIYAGTPDFAVPALRQLLDSEHQVVAVYTQPDRPAGRGKKLRASPVKQVALERGIPVYQPQSLKHPDDQQVLQALDADVMIVAAYGLLLPEEVLKMPRLGCINIHASLLPRWRGAAPIHRAILAGDEQTGITIMQMAKGLDTGDLLLTRALAISPSDTSASLHDALAELGASSMMEVLKAMADQKMTGQPQDDALAIYAHKLKKTEAPINWRDSAQQIDRQIRAFNPWPVAQTDSELGVLRIWSAALADEAVSGATGQVVKEDKHRGLLVQTGQGGLWLQRLQLPGGKPLDAPAFLNTRSLLNQKLG